MEKSLLKTKVEGDVSGVKDIVRAMATVSQMLSVARLLRLLRKMQEEGLVSVLRVKERFLRAPSGSVISGYGSLCHHPTTRAEPNPLIPAHAGADGVM